MAVHTYLYVNSRQFLSQKLFILVLFLVDANNMYFGLA